MLIEKALEIVGGILNYLLNYINIPDMPEMIAQKLESVRVYMLSGLNIFGFFVDINYFRVCCSFFLLLFATHSTWKFVRWLLKKIPFLNMS